MRKKLKFRGNEKADTCMHWKILAQEYDEKFKYYYRKRNCVFIFPEVVLKKRRAIRKFNSNKEKEKREYINYCRIVLYSIVELIEISGYSGMNYKEFVREALEKKIYQQVRNKSKR